MHHSLVLFSHLLKLKVINDFEKSIKLFPNSFDFLIFIKVDVYLYLEFRRFPNSKIFQISFLDSNPHLKINIILKLTKQNF